MNRSEWDEISGFASPGEFENFLSWINSRIKDGAAEEIPVKSHYYSVNEPPPKDWNTPGKYWHPREKWFHHKASGAVWRLVWPDPPDRGLFKPVGE